VADGGLQAIERAAKEVVGTLSSTSLILIMGLIISLVVGNLVAWRSTRAITAPISEGVSALSTTASQISATIAQLASNASETAAAVSETTTTVDEVRQTAQVAADRAKAVADSAKGAALAAETGRKATQQTVEGLNLIRDQMGSIGESITRLNEQSQAVGDIVSTVADLAEQSNLLAVNASIEAAKAGDAGKGFAVVAQEIRNLAEQSKDSTKQVRAILTEVQKATGKAVVASEQGVRIVADGSQQADEAGQAIASLTSTVQDSTRAAVQIATSSQQQLIGMEQVGRAMENIKNATAQNAEGARQLGTAAHNLQELGTRLKTLIGSDADVGMGPQQK
jgi:methyl-accepting chemotaxis protein